MTNRIKELRINKNLTQKDIAKLINVSDRSVGFYETGKRDPDTETLKTLADFFHVSIDYLLGRNEIKNQIETKPTNNRESRFTKEEIGKIKSFEAWLILERNKKEESATEEMSAMGK